MTESDTAVSVDRGGPDPHDIPRQGRSGFVRIADRQVHYLEWGHSDAPLVLALHGGGQTSYMFEDLGTALLGRRHVIAPDLPHHGESAPLARPAGFSRHALADTMPPLLAEFGSQPVAVVGASLGGIIGLTLAASRPDLVSCLVLIDVGHRLEEAGVRRIVDFMRSHESFESLEAAADAITDYLPHRKAADPSRLTRNLRQRPDGRWSWKHDMARLSNEQFDSGNWRNILDGLGNDAANLTVPVLVLRGAHSDVLSQDGAAEIGDLLPDARVVEIGAAGHLAAGDNPTSTATLVQEFLDEILPTTT